MFTIRYENSYENQTETLKWNEMFHPLSLCLISKSIDLHNSLNWIHRDNRVEEMLSHYVGIKWI